MPAKAGLGFLPSAKLVLQKSGKPMSCKEIVIEALAQGYLVTSGKTPENTLHAILIRDIKSNKKTSEFIAVQPGKFILINNSKSTV